LQSHSILFQNICLSQEHHQQPTVAIQEADKVAAQHNATQHNKQMVLYTPDEMLEMGLLQAGFDANRQGRVKMETNVRRFTSHYGSSPLVCAAIWEDLLTTTIPDARISQRMDPANFFLGMYYLKEYPTEEKLAGSFKTCEKTTRKWAWYFASKLQALKEMKVSPSFILL
jgi:hypothetical protein